MRQGNFKLNSVNRLRMATPTFLAVALFSLPCSAVETSALTEVVENANGLGIGDIDLTDLIAMITAIGGLGAAAFSLVDAMKVAGGGPSNIGFGDLEKVMTRFAAALDAALGKGEWKEVVRAHWINGRPRGEQKAIVKSLIRLGLSETTAPMLATAGHVDAAGLAAVAEKLNTGAELSEVDLNLLGRLDASIDAQLDAAFDRADQRYRNAARGLAGLASVALAFLATWALGRDTWAMAFVIGLLAVPLAPIAKDLASSLQAAASALRVAK